MRLSRLLHGIVHSALAGLVAALVLGGCTPGAVRPASHGPDLFALEKEAETLYRQERFAEALVKYQALARLAPDNALVHFCLGNTRARLGRDAEAAASYERALTLDPDLSRAAYNLGIVRLHQSLHALEALASRLPDGDPLRALAERQAGRLRGFLQDDRKHAGTP